jgi:asparagine synthase (glutamine-hydrolysing)
MTSSPDYVDELLSDSAVRRTGYFNPVKVAGLAKKIRCDEAASAGEMQDMAFLGILSTQLLHHEYVGPSIHSEAHPATPDKVVRLDRPLP